MTEADNDMVVLNGVIDTEANTLIENLGIRVTRDEYRIIRLAVARGFAAGIGYSTDAMKEASN